MKDSNKSTKTAHSNPENQFPENKDIFRVEEEEDHFDICQNACSTTDCTGLIPNLADDEEIESYQELYDFLPQAATNKKST